MGRNAWARWLDSLSGQDAGPQTAPVDIEGLRRGAVALLADCQGVRCERVRNRLRGSLSARDLVLIRSEVFQVVASQHCESVAAERVKALLPR